jgi:hypothetical protein
MFHIESALKKLRAMVGNKARIILFFHLFLIFKDYVIFDALMNNFLFLMQDVAKVEEVSEGAVQGSGPILGQFFEQQQTSRAIERCTWR